MTEQVEFLSGLWGGTCDSGAFLDRGPELAGDSDCRAEEHVPGSRGAESSPEEVCPLNGTRTQIQPETRPWADSV